MWKSLFISPNSLNFHWFICDTPQQNVPGFFLVFSRKLTRTKKQKITDKSSEHNGCTVLSQALVFLKSASTVTVSTSYFILNPVCITLPHNFCQLPFLLPPPQLTECATADRVRCPLGSGGHAKAYYRVDPQPLNNSDTTTTMYPTAADLSANHHASGAHPSFRTVISNKDPPLQLWQSFFRN